MSSTSLNDYLHKSFDELYEYGRTNGYRVFKAYSGPVELIDGGMDIVSSPNRLEVQMYVGESDKTYVKHIIRYVNFARLDDFDIDSLQTQSQTQPQTQPQTQSQTQPSIYKYLKSVFPNESYLHHVMNKMGKDKNEVFVFIGKTSSGKSLFTKFITQLYPEKFSTFNYIDDPVNETLTVELSKYKPIIICVKSLNEIKHLKCWEKTYLVHFENNFKPDHNMHTYISDLANEYRAMKSLMNY